MKVCTVSYIIQSILSDENSENPVYNLSPYPPGQNNHINEDTILHYIVIGKGFCYVAQTDLQSSYNSLLSAEFPFFCWLI